MFFLLGVKIMCVYVRKYPYFIENWVRVKWPGIFSKCLKKRNKKKRKEGGKEGGKAGEQKEKNKRQVWFGNYWKWDDGYMRVHLLFSLFLYTFGKFYKSHENIQNAG